MTFSNKFIIAIAISFSIIITSCNSSEKQQKAPSAQKISVIPVIEFDVPIFTSYVGQIHGSKDIPIRARVEGFLESVDFKEGSNVKKGQLLYTIDPQSLAAATNAQKSEVNAAQTALKKAKADLDRIRPLAEANAISQSELDASQANYDDAKARVKTTKANLKASNIELSYTKVLSPINGLIGKTNAQVGEFVGKDPNPVILNTVSAIDTITVKFSLTEAQYIKMFKQYKERVNAGELDDGEHNRDVELQLADESIYGHLGIVDFVDRNVDENTGTLLAQASFPNPDKMLRPGMYSKVKIKTGILKSAIVIPQRCIMELQGSYSVFVLSDSNKIVKVPVTVGNKTGDLAAITEGLKKTDKIVIDGLQKVRSGVKIIPIDTVFHSAIYKRFTEAQRKKLQK